MKKRKLFHDYDELLGGYYGFSKKTHKRTTTSFDTNEVIAQSLRAYAQTVQEEEYVVQASVLPGEAEEEYVVQQSELPGELEEEYVVANSLSEEDEDEIQSSIFNSDPEIAAMLSYTSDDEEDEIQSSVFNSDPETVNALSYYFSEPTFLNSDTNIASENIDQSYQTTILDPFSQMHSTPEYREYEEEQVDMPQSFGISDDRFNSFENNDNTNQFAPSSNSSGSSANNPASAKEEELINDLQAILSGKKVYDSSSGKTVDRDQLGTQQSVSKTKQADPPENPHTIFDRIKENMQYANAYNLGTIPLNTSQLENRFNELDAITESEKKVNKSQQSIAQSIPNKPVSKTLDFDTTEFLQDLESIQKGSDKNQNSSLHDTNTSDQFTVDIHSKHYPERPTNIRPYTSKERLQVFGNFSYEADPSTFDGDGIKVLDNWTASNIVSVSIPQLNGKKFGKQIIKNGTIKFHTLGADLLKKLWAAWETAGLLDKIVSFEGGYAARYIRGTQSRSPRPLSNHAWGTAFDINAPWNGLGKEPALVGQTGCVRELVTIANENGFFWGGHFNGKKDGMHFELGKII